MGSSGVLLNNGELQGPYLSISTLFSSCFALGYLKNIFSPTLHFP